MVQIEPFAVEQWMDAYETTPGVLNIAETCCASVSIDDLVQFSTETDAKSPLVLGDKMTYGAIRGSRKLREHVAALCSADGRQPLHADNVIITAGAINANFLLFYSLIGPGDHAVCVYPTYQQLYSVPVSLGAEVSLWKLSPEQGYVPDIRELEVLVKANTKMIVLNNPNNPSGVAIPTGVMQEIVDFAKERGIIVFSDEVYRPLFHNGPDKDPTLPRPAVTYGYEKTIVTGSMSKAFALAGIRLGWIASSDKDIIEAIAAARDYTTISVSKLDDQVATFALSPEVKESLLQRNIALANTNRELLAKFVQEHADICSWVEPSAGTTAFVKFLKSGMPVKDTEFCLDVLEKTKAFMVPGSHCFGGGSDFEGYVRMGYVCETEVLRLALEKLSAYVNTHLLP